MSMSTLAEVLTSYLQEAENQPILALSISQTINTPGTYDSALRAAVSALLAKHVKYSDQRTIAGVSEAVADIESGVSRLLDILSSVHAAVVQKAMDEAEHVVSDDDVPGLFGDLN